MRKERPNNPKKLNNPKENLDEMLIKKGYSKKDIKLLRKQISRLRLEIPPIICSALNNTFNIIIKNLNLLPENKKKQAIKELINILDDLKKSSVFPEINKEIERIKNLLNFTPTSNVPKKFDVATKPTGGPLSSIDNPQNNP